MRNPADYQREVTTRVGVLVRNAGGTYRAASTVVGLSAQTISAWNRRQRVPRPDSLVKLRAAS